MREIKFRAWDKRKSNWVEHFGIESSTGYMFENEANYLPFEDRDNFILMQYTNLKDKNGKEIYEGDIVKGIVKQPQLFSFDNDENCNTKMGGEVYYDHHNFSLKVIENLCDKERDGMVNYFEFISENGGDFEEMEIIGNIYENPELLK